MSKEQTLDIYGKSYNRSLLVLVLLVGSFVTVINQTLLATALPTIMDAFDISAATAQWLSTGFLLVNGIMIPVSAWMLTRFSTKSLYTSAMGIFLVGTIICYVAPNFSLLLIGRLVQAVGVGISMPMLQTIMLSIFPPDKRGAAMGMTGIVIGLAPAIGPTYSGWIVDNFSWRTLFGPLIPISIVVMILSLLFMKKVLPTQKVGIDVSSVIMSTLGFGALLYGVSSVGDKGWGSPEVLLEIIIGVIFVTFFVIRQLRIEQPLVDLRVFKSTTFTLATLLSSLSTMAMIGAEMVIPLYIQNIHGETAFNSGLMLLPGALMMGVFMPISGRIVDKRGAKRLAMTGMFLLTAATIPFIFLTPETSIISIMIVYGIRMIGVALVMMPVTTAGMNSLPNELLKHGTAANNTLRQVASSIGTAILISVLTNVTTNELPKDALLQSSPLAYKDQATAAVMSGYQAAFVVAVLFSAIGLFVTFFLNDRTTKQLEVKLDGGAQ
ncbi:MAG: MDR family MFS transporter [Enterococcus sp.]